MNMLGRWKTLGRICSSRCCINYIISVNFALGMNAAETDGRITSRARDLSRKFAERLKDAAPGSTHGVAFLTVLAGLKDVARHLGNIAERIPSIS